LIERIDVPDGRLDEHFVLVNRDQPSQRSRGQLSGDQRRRRAASREGFVQRKLLPCAKQLATNRRDDLGLRSLATLQSLILVRAERALVMVSKVVKVLDETMNSVLRGFKVFNVSAMLAPSTFER